MTEQPRHRRTLSTAVEVGGGTVIVETTPNLMVRIMHPDGTWHAWGSGNTPRTAAISHAWAVTYAQTELVDRFS